MKTWGYFTSKLITFGWEELTGDDIFLLQLLIGNLLNGGHRLNIGDITKIEWIPQSIFKFKFLIKNYFNFFYPIFAERELEEVSFNMTSKTTRTNLMCLLWNFSFSGNSNFLSYVRKFPRIDMSTAYFSKF